MKLKDIFPKWLFRERSYGELELGGGSSFAHLTEDDHGVYIDLIAGYRLVRIEQSAHPQVGFTDLAGASIYSFLHTGAVSPDNSVYELWTDQGNGNYPIFQWNEDGSLHWGDGVNAPDTHLKRDGEVVALDIGLAQQALTVGRPLSNGHYVAIGTNPNGDGRPSVEFYDGTHDIYLQVDADGDLFVPGKGKVAFQP